ncbi:MAG: hypothetical protein CL677_01105 [Bdellovibrionaceae bacterium]|nr:hypothetical protein [Pseudobdellovibrionaceae bacterium]
MSKKEILFDQYGIRINRAVASPIRIMNFWDLTDAFLGLLTVLVFGIIFYSFWIMVALLIAFLIIGPLIKTRNNRGIYLHWPYRYLGMSLPGLVNPGNRKRFSD